MGHSKVLTLRRAFVKLLLTLAATYAVTLTLTRDSADDELVQSFRKTCKKVVQAKGAGVKG